MRNELLYKFFNGAASYDEEVYVRTWMESSEENKRKFYHERKIFDALLLQADGTLKEIKKPKRMLIHNHTFREFIKIASVVLLTLTADFLYQTYQEAHQPIAMQTIHVPAGQYINITLPDGTLVWLNARTTFRYPVNFTKKQRNVELNGEAYFEVTKNENSPFSVKTDKHTVKVLGTKFNIEAYSEKNNFVTTLMEGKVSIHPTASPSTPLLLKPNTKAIYENGELTVQYVDDYSVYRWREGLICFKDASFASIMEDFEKYYGVKISINNNKVNKNKYTGKFRQRDGVDYALHVLQRDIYFSYKKDDELQTITIE